ncbi:diguanylate cyclase [Pseudaeromonas paramecii]|uniref:diguanylate cyclase n=1 Tax=Pseudaeromonas paramecii TaxID=2138166 RepID=A0ABP8Q7F3_9GAMM
MPCCCRFGRWLAGLLVLLSLPAMALESVVLQLKWTHQFQFAGYYAALEQGYYRAAGLDVQLKPNGQDGISVSPVEEVLSGRAHYGISNSGLVKIFMAGKPVVVLAAILQHSAVTWLVLERSGIQTLHDLSSRRLMTALPVNESYELLAPFHAEGVAVEQLNLIPTTHDLRDLLAGKVDAYDAYVTNEPYQLEQMGIPYRLIQPRSYGIDFYGDVLFTSRQEMRDHPERVKAFREATLKGWHYAIEHVDEMVDLIRQRYAPYKSREHLLFEAHALIKLIQPDFVALGHMNPGRWARIAEIEEGNGQTVPLSRLEGFFYQEEPPSDGKFWLMSGIFVLVALGLLAIIGWIVKINVRLRLEIAARKAAELQLRRLSRTDHLTGQHNRRAFFQVFTREFARFRRHPHGLTLLMLDIDHFKLVNDQYGHPVGDLVLVEFGRRLKAQLRRIDELGRIGGEEFAILLTDTTLEEAAIKAEQLRKAIAHPPFVMGRECLSLQITTSIGVVAAHPNDKNPKQLLARADEALYQAKSQGRNRCVTVP